MTIQIDTTKLQDIEQAPLIHAFIAPEHQYPEPKAGVEGVSFPDIPMLRPAITTGVIAVGTITVGGEPLDHAKYEDLRVDAGISTIAGPAVTGAVAEQYARLRVEMERVGLPLLDDEELRQEIKDRKGARPEFEA
jgi:hypothetical protein